MPNGGNRNIKAYLRQFKEHERLRAALSFACLSAVALVPFYLFARAAGAWTPHPVFFPDDAFYARLCLPDGLRLYWHDFGLYRILTILPYALVNRTVMRAALSPALLGLVAIALATFAFIWTCLAAGLTRRRGALLTGVMLGSPVLLETVNFWSGTLNYALVLLLVAAQLRACMWARRAATGETAKESASGAAKKLLVTAGGALTALLTYEIALPFVLATSAFYVRGWLRRAATVGVAVLVALAFVAALAAAGLYWPQRFKLATEGLISAASETTAIEHNSAGGNTAIQVIGSAPAPAIDQAETTATGNERAPVLAAPLVSAPERARMYVSLLVSFIGTGLRLSPGFWVVVLAVLGMKFLRRRVTEKRFGEAAEKVPGAEQVPKDVLAWAFAFAFAACAGYLVLTNSMNARYAAFLLIYGAATLAWTRGRAAACALASLLLVQAAVAASLPVHMRDVELASGGQALASFAGGADIISVNGRLARASWGKRFVAPPPADALTRPLNSRACRYAMPCEECK